jgi:hypothetical protein
LPVHARLGPQPAQRAVLGDADRARAHAQCQAGLLGRHADGDPQQEDLALLVGQPLQQRASQVRLARPDRQRLGPLRGVGVIGQLRDRRGPPGRGPMDVGDLARRDRVDEGLERHALVAIRRKRGEHRDAHLLRRVVRRALVAGAVAQPSSRVAVHESAYGDQEALGRVRVSAQGMGGESTQVGACGGGIRHRCDRAECPRRYTLYVGHSRPIARPSRPDPGLTRWTAATWRYGLTESLLLRTRHVSSLITPREHAPDGNRRRRPA